LARAFLVLAAATPWGTAQAAVCSGGTTACGSATNVTYNGTALTFAGASTNGTVRTEIWYLKAPATGTRSIVVTAPYATDITASSMSFTGVDQTTPLGTLVTNIGTGTSASVVASTILGEPVFDVMGAVGTTTPTVSGSTQTVRNTNNTSTGIGRIVSGTSTAFGQAAPVTMSWTVSSADWAIAAVPIKASTPLTGVEVGSFTAKWEDGGTLIQWRSGYQPTTVGFYVHRREGNNPRTRLNSEIIQGSALKGTLAAYSWTDSTPGWNGPVSYWLEEVDQHGGTKWYGPASPVPPPAETEPVATPVMPRPDGSTDGFVPLGGFAGTGGGGPVAGLSEAQGGCVIGSRAPNLDAARMLVLLGVGLSARRRKGRRGWVLPALLVALLIATTFVGQHEAGAAGGVTVDATATGTGASGLTFSHTMGTGSNGLLVVGVVMPIACVNTTTDQGSCGACGATCSLDTSGLSSGLIGLWHFNEGTGTTSADSSGTGSTASLGGSPSWTTGYSGTGLQFNGTSSFAQASLTSYFGANNPLTAAVWVYATTNTNGPIFGVTSIPSGGGWNMPFLSINGATVYGQIWSNTIISSTVGLNAWHLVALTYDNSSSPSTRLYVDGAQVATTTGTYSPSNLVDYWTTYIPGAKPGGVNNYLRGRIDEVRAYNRVLSAGELSSLYTARLACASSTCAACGSGKTDCSGSCVTTATDVGNCGGCGITCNTVGGQTCTAGACVCSNPAYTSCSTVCVNLQTDNNNCGGCGVTCNTAGGETCSAGACVCSNMALTNCSRVCVDPTTNPSNCGACGTVCSNDTPAFVNSGLLGRWKLDEATGSTASDYSGNGRTATLTNSPTWTAAYSGYGLTFNGSTNYLNANLGTWFGSNNPLTASAWVYATSTTNGPIFGVLSTPPNTGWNMPFLSIAGATAYGHIWQVNGNVPLSSTVTLNAWHHLAITYEPGVGEKFYIDGTQVASATGTFSPSGTTDYWSTNISGTKPSGVNSVLNGLIDDVRAYSRVLSASEIAVIYNSRQSCAASACGGCGGGLSVCGGTCTNTTLDPGNCGGCGTTCNTAGGQTCVASACTCATGTNCSSICVDTTTDNNNCGGCGVVCGTTTCPSCAQSMIGYWHLDEGTGTTSADSSGNGRTVTLTNGPTWTTGYSSNALTFDGINDYINANLGTWFGNNNTISVSAWVYATSSTNGPIFGVTSSPPGGSWNMPFLSINGSTVYGWFWQVNGNTPLQATVSLNAWHHLVATYDPSAGEKFYVDGALAGSGTGTFLPAGATVYWTTYIGGAKPSGVNSYMTGKFDEVRAYKRVLSAGEVKLLYDSRQACASSTCNNCPSGTTACSLTCTNTQADPANCNGCGITCSGGTPYCVAGACSATP
jgi:hypothetical protein